MTDEGDDFTSAISAIVPVAAFLGGGRAECFLCDLVACSVEIVMRGYVTTVAAIPAAAPETPSTTSAATIVNSKPPRRGCGL